MNHPEDYDSILAALHEEIGAGLPGVTAQLRMSFPSRERRELMSVDGRQCAEAGVLVLVTSVGGRAHVLLTVRKTTLARHPGQISFPGGRREANEDLLTTALRETEEEVNVQPAAVRVIGALTPLYIPPSGYCVYPFLGSSTGITPIADEREVDRILQIPVADLLSGSLMQHHTRSFRGTPVEVPCFNAGGDIIWGATAMILSEVIALLERHVPACD